jgi:hypothetical protein
MSLTELLPVVHALSRADKLRLMQVLVADIAGEEGIDLPAADTAHAIWTPYDAYDAANVLLHVRASDEAASLNTTLTRMPKNDSQTCAASDGP